MWWESADEEMRGKLRALLASGRLEMTTGGWIMTDEAVVAAAADVGAAVGVSCCCMCDRMLSMSVF